MKNYVYLIAGFAIGVLITLIGTWLLHDCECAKTSDGRKIDSVTNEYVYDSARKHFPDLIQLNADRVEDSSSNPENIRKVIKTVEVPASVDTAAILSMVDTNDIIDKYDAVELVSEYTSYRQYNRSFRDHDVEIDIEAGVRFNRMDTLKVGYKNLRETEKNKTIHTTDYNYQIWAKAAFDPNNTSIGVEWNNSNIEVGGQYIVDSDYNLDPVERLRLNVGIKLFQQ